MARYIDEEIDVTFERERDRDSHKRHRDRRAHPVYDIDSPRDSSLAALSPAYASGDYRAERGALIRPHAPPTVIEEAPTVVEHEHHHLHHHIDHGNVNDRLAMARVNPRPGLSRDYSYDDLDVDVRERRYRGADGVTVTRIQERDGGHHRHRHRHRRSRHGSSLDRGRYSRSDVDLSYDHYSRRRREGYADELDVDERDFTIVDVPAGTKRVTIVNEKDRDARDLRESRYIYSERDITWRRDRGVRRSRGLGNELWTEITKDLICREAIEDMGYPFEETDFFFYVFDYLDHDQINELIDITADIRRQRVRQLEYDSVSGRSGLDAAIPRRLRDDYVEDTRTEVIVEQGRSSRRRPNRYYNY